MEIEDILSTLGMAVLAIVSLVFRAANNKKSSNPKPVTTTNEAPSHRSVTWGHTTTAHPDSSETIFDETKGYQRTSRKNVEQENKVANTKNATNRTSKHFDKNEAQTNSNESIAKKINLRDAVIYSEILAPKFKEEE